MVVAVASERASIKVTAPSLSPSRAADFMQCPMLYRFRVIDRLPEAPSAAAARGTLVHAALERAFDLPADRRTREAVAALLGACWAAVVEDRPELATLVDSADPRALDAWLEEALRLVERWFTLEDPTRLEPAAREMYVEADVDGLTLRGYVDRLDVAPDGRMRVVDYKTGRSPSVLFEARALFQMKFYALVLWRMRGRVPTLLQLVYLGDGEILRYAPDEHDLLAVERKVKSLWAAIARAGATGDFRPSPGRLCGWCDHQSLCPAWGGTPPPLPERAAELAVDPAVAGDPGPAED
ncbi:MAG: PD-(D/E)XK nuclease family protein [Austwickia sp.]|nr:PD-(D/E)XK nuclease family protein [Austwickia sp.]